MASLDGFSVQYTHLKFERVVTVRHQGNVIAIATATDNETKEKTLYFNILDLDRQATSQRADAAERKERETADAAHADAAEAWNDSRYWTGFRKLEFPDEVRLAGMSLLSFPAKEPGDQPGTHWVVVSNGADLYLFRAVGGTVYGNRYNLAVEPLPDGEGTRPTLRLKTEVRFRRSRMKDMPAGDKDAPGPLDMDDRPFIEPTLSFHQHLKPLGGLFGVCVAPGHQVGRFRWQFVYEETIPYRDAQRNKLEDKQLASVSILSSEDGWVDLSDIVTARFKMTCPFDNGRGHGQVNYLHFKDAPALLVFRPQEIAKQPEGDIRLLPTAPRLMLAAAMTSTASTTADLVVVDFRLQTEGDGTPFIPRIKSRAGSPTDIFHLDVPRFKKDASGKPILRQFGKAWDQLSAELGILDWLKTDVSPTLLDSADGCLHLYSLARGSGNLEATRYNFASNWREIQSLGWQAGSGLAGGKQTAGKLYLTSRKVGHADPGFSAKVTFDAGQPALRHIFAYTNLAAGKNPRDDWAGMSEDWRGLPGDVEDLLAILNGQASNDPHDPLVQSGNRPFYDYEGKHLVYWLVPSTVSQAWREQQGKSGYAATPTARYPFLITRKDANPILNTVEIQATENSSTCTAKLWFNGQNDPKKPWDFMVRLRNLPRSPAAFVRALSGNAADGGTPASVGRIMLETLVVSVSDDADWLSGVAITNATDGDASKCDLVITKTDGNKISFANLARDRKKLLDGVKHDGWTRTIKDVRGSVTCALKGNAGTIHVSLDTTTIRKAVNQTVDTRPNVAELFQHFSVLHNGAREELANVSLTRGAALPQGYTTTWKPTAPGTFEHSWRDGSAIFRVSSDPLPASGATARLDPPAMDHRNTKLHVLEATVDTYGKHGGWIIESKPAMLNFASNSSFAVSLNDGQQAALVPAGDFSVEAWVRPTSRDNKQRILTAAAADSRRTDDYALGLEDAAAIGGNVLELTSPGDSFTVANAEFNSQSFSLAFWAKTDASFAQIFQLGGLTETGAYLQYATQNLGYNYRQPGEWIFLGLAYDKKTSLVTKIFTSDDASTSSGSSLTSFLTGNCNVKALTFTGSSGNTLSIRSPALWNRALSSAELDEVRRLGVAPDSNGLVGLYRFRYGLAKGRSIANDASTAHGNLPGLVTGDGAKIVGASAGKLFHLNASAGGRHVRSRHAIAGDNEWTHVAAACRHNRAVRFKAAEKQKAVCANGRDLDPEEAFSIDVLIRPTGLTGVHYLLAKQDAAGNGYALGLRPKDGRWSLFLDFVIEDRKSGATHRFSAVGAAEIEPNKPYYVAIGAGIAVGTPPLKTKPNKDNKKDSKEEREEKEVDAIFKVLQSSGNDASKVSHLTAFAFISDLSRPEADRNPSVTLEEGGSSASSSARNPSGEWRFQATGDNPVFLGCRSPKEGGWFDGEIGMVRFWERSIAADVPALATTTGMPHGVTPPSVDWRFNEGRGRTVTDVEGANSFTLDSAYMWCDSRLTAEIKLFANGREIEHVAAKPEEMGSYGKTDKLLQIGAGKTKNADTDAEHFIGQLQDIRIWDEARSPEQIADHVFARLHGNERHLLCYLPLDGRVEVSVTTMENHKRTTVHRVADGPLNDGYLLAEGSHPVLFRKIKKSEWHTDWATTAGDHKKPHLPPVGTDMPVVRDSLLVLSTAWQAKGKLPAAGVEYGELQADEEGLLSGVMKRGYAYVANGACVMVTGFRIGDLAMDYVGQIQTRPQLHGYIEGAPPLPSENMTRPFWTSPTAWQSYTGASSVQIVEADNTLRSLSGDKKVSVDAALHFGIGPAFDAEVEGGMGIYSLIFRAGAKPFTVNTRTDFSGGYLKSAQVSSGSTRTLDNSIAASGDWEPWYQDGDTGHKAERRIQKHFGRRYVPDNVGYALVKSRVANLYVLRLKSTGTVIGMQILPDPDIPEDFNIIIFPIEKSYTKQGTLDGKIGFFDDPDFPNADQQRGSYYRPKEAYSLVAEIEAQEAALDDAWTETDASHLGQATDMSPKTDVGYGPADRAEWRKERKTRNMVNSYVWTAAGGLHAEEEQTALTRQESAGGSFDNTTSLGVDAEYTFKPGIYVDGGATFGFAIHSTVTKSKEEGRDFALKVHVDAEGYLRRWNEGKAVPDGGKAVPDGGKAVPDGGKAKPYAAADTPGTVSAYRFKTFYLAPGKTAFDSFFTDVVDRNWLANSSDPNAVALREAKGRPNEVWRVLHRVTYVARVPSPTGVPDVEAVAAAAPAMDVTANQALVDQLAREVLKFKTGSESERIGKAVAEYLTANGSAHKAGANGKGGDLRTESSEWKALADHDPDRARRLERAVFLYMRSLGLKGLADNSSDNRKNWHEKEAGTA